MLRKDYCGSKGLERNVSKISQATRAGGATRQPKKNWRGISDQSYNKRKRRDSQGGEEKEKERASKENGMSVEWLIYTVLWA
jgi:hypothetical protein